MPALIPFVVPSEDILYMWFCFVCLPVLQSQCAQYTAEKRDEEKMCDHLIRAAKYRDHMTATQLIQKIVNILTDKHGAWGSSASRYPAYRPAGWGRLPPFVSLYF